MISFYKMLRTKRNKRGFTLVELIIAMLIIGILTVAGITAYTTQIDKARITAFTEDMKGFDTVIKQFLLENPQVAKDAVVNDYQDPKVLVALNSMLEAEMRIDLTHSGVEGASTNNVATGGNDTLTLNTITPTTVVATYREDPWGTRYKIFVNPDQLTFSAEAGVNKIVPSTNVKQSDIRIMIVSNGKNQTTSLDLAKLDGEDDLMFMVEVVNGQMRSGYYGMKGTSSANTVVIMDPRPEEEDLKLAALPVIE